MIDLTSFFTEDEAVRIKNIIRKSAQRAYYKDRILNADVIRMSDYMPESPQYEKVESGAWRPAGVRGFIESILPLP